jgi:methylenetetrahydrofolate--tRNA-(uracil-5-)-methyltransferase
MAEMRQMGSLLLSLAEQVAVPAGGALAVDREVFARRVSERIGNHPRIRVVRQEAKKVPAGLVVVASGPLTSAALSKDLQTLTGEEHLFFYDALSPIVEADSIDMRIAFRASRYGRGQAEEGDYLNLPFDQQAYDRFVEALVSADRIPLRDFENDIPQGVRAGRGRYFEGCLPVEVIASRGQMALAFGPMRPVGLVDPRTGKRPYAVVQLRQDNLAGNLYNLVGFQTNLTYEAQGRVLKMIPGLQNAIFVRYGQMHRNTFLNAPQVLGSTLQHRDNPHLLFCGQLTGVEGYLGSMATGLLAGVNAFRVAEGAGPFVLPQTTMLGALCHYIAHADAGAFQPMKANFGILPPLTDGVRRNRRQRAQAYAERSKTDLAGAWRASGEKLRIAI